MSLSLLAPDELWAEWVLDQALARSGRSRHLPLSKALALYVEVLGLQTGVEIGNGCYRLMRRTPEARSWPRLPLELVENPDVRSTVKRVFAALDPSLAPSGYAEACTIWAPVDLRVGVDDQVAELAIRLKWIRNLVHRLVSRRAPDRPKRHDLSRDTLVYVLHKVAGWNVAKIADQLSNGAPPSKIEGATPNGRLAGRKPLSRKGRIRLVRQIVARVEKAMAAAAKDHLTPPLI